MRIFFIYFFIIISIKSYFIIAQKFASHQQMLYNARTENKNCVLLLTAVGFVRQLVVTLARVGFVKVGDFLIGRSRSLPSI